MFIIHILLFLWEWKTPWQFSKHNSKLLFQISVQVFSLLDQTESMKKTIF